MIFNDNIGKEKYKKFYLENNGNFMQSYEWGQFNIKSRHQIPHYVGIEENGTILCEALLLEKKGPFQLSYFYCPRGYIIDFNNTELFEKFTEELKKFVKKHHGIYLKVDPEIEYQEIDALGQPIENGKNNYDLYNKFISLGYKHTGFIKNFENNQPRYTFKIDLDKPVEELEKSISKSVLKKIKKTYDYNMIFRENSDPATFYNLICKTSEKDNFAAYSKSYYEEAMNILGKENIYRMFELVISPKELICKQEEKNKILKEKLSTAKESEKNELNEQMSRIEKELKILEPYKDLDELVICSQICAETKDTMWTLYIGNDEIGKDLYAVNRMYLEVIKYAKNTNHKYLDLFGTTGDVNHTHGNLAGIHNFKKNFGGKYTEYIGEFDLVNKKILNKILPIFLKIYRKITKKKTNR